MAPTAVDADPREKPSLLRWWKSFTAGERLEPRAGPSAVYVPPSRGRDGDGRGKVFGVPLQQSLRYASVAISMLGPDGAPQIFGYVPIVVAKCGMMLKETGTATEGIFRVSGANRRINQLQEVFDSPPRYGKDLDWEGFSVHDAASVLRRFLNMMPEPVIPENLYRDFTAVLQESHTLTESIASYRTLISRLPPTSRYLLLYLLDFLSVFARCSDQNLMTSSNLAVVFQPGLVSTRAHESSGALLGFPGFEGGRVPTSADKGKGAAQQGAGEHARGKQVLEFLIEQQAHFVLDLEPAVSAELDPYASGVAGPSHAATALARSGSGREGGPRKLERRSSEKSAERRRARRELAESAGAGKVKRSKTVPSRRTEELPAPSAPNASALDPSSRLAAKPSRAPQPVPPAASHPPPPVSKG